MRCLRTRNMVASLLAPLASWKGATGQHRLMNFLQTVEAETLALCQTGIAMIHGLQGSLLSPNHEAHGLLLGMLSHQHFAYTLHMGCFSELDNSSIPCTKSPLVCVLLSRIVVFATADLGCIMSMVRVTTANHLSSSL